MHWKERISTNKNILGGRPAIKGTRISVSLILELMSAGDSEASLLNAYPHICVEDIRACLRYASESLEPPPLTEFDRWVEGVDDEDCN